MVDRVIWVILDSVGCGELPDAPLFGDEGSNTLSNTIKATGIQLPNLSKLGLGKIEGVDGLVSEEPIIGNYGKCNEMSNGKDTTIGHWEMAGIYSPNPLPTYPNGFPEDVMEAFKIKTGYDYLCNLPYSGTQVLDDYAKEHLETKKLIIYTSGDSVFQIAAHEELIPVEELYRICNIARDILGGEHAVARVIARPFIGQEGAYKRTSNRRDFSLKPPTRMILDELKDAGYPVVGIGKIEDIFNQQGITEAIHTKDNMDGIHQTLKYMETVEKGLIYTNLVEFDSTWGHRNDVAGYAGGLVAFDNRLPEILSAMNENDVLIINADHGCDPTTPSTDHSREYIPLIVYGKSLRQDVSIGIRQSFADIGQTIAEMFQVNKVLYGESFLNKINKEH